MLDKIYHYAINNIDNIQSSDFKQSKIGGYIHLNQAGEYQFVEIVENPEFSSFPAISNTGSSSTNILIEKLNIVLGMHDAAKREAYYLGKVNECLASCNKLMPVITFLETVRQNKELCVSIAESVKKGDVKLKKDLFSFKIDGNKIEEIPEIVAAMRKAIPIPADAIVGTSSITNEEKVLCSQPVKFRFKPPVKDDNYSYDFPLAPFSKSPSTGSYFQEGAIISRMGSDEVDAIKIGLETLLNDKNHYNVFFKLLHWYDDELNLHPYQQEIFDFNAFVTPDSQEETIDEEQNESVNPKAFDRQAADVLTAVQTADEKALGNIENNIYHVAFCYAPCKSRFKLYGHREWSVFIAFK